MRVYIFQADIYCEACGEAIRAERICNGARDDGTSDTLPQGPYGNGGGEADTPQHCGACGEFLENPLTSDGLAYVAERVAEKPRHGIAARIWAPFYGVR